ncbi:acetyl-CoA C-acetyltransferase family protein [Burkholderia pseudomallei MSHR332]|nr:acetyl-CoA C-acetyltransferase family protein [Burkholderia pseudomallei MSHR332]
MTAVDQDPIVIASAARTPIAGFQGEFASLAAPQLGAAAIAAALERAGLQPEQIDEAVMGCVLPAGQGQAPARQAALGAKLPLSVGCTTINKMCGSGMRAAMFAHDMLVAGSVDVIVAGGMESMTNAPYLLPKARAGMRMGHGQVLDHMFLDGLEDAYDKGRLMGTFAEECAGEYAFSRDAQDAFAIESLARAKRANEDGSFAWEIAPVTVAGKKGDAVIARDEQPFKANPEKIPTLKPAFSKTGTVTAANSSSISDGAAALVMMRASTANRLGLAPLARVVGHSTFAQAPSKFTTAPVGAIRRLFEKKRLARGRSRPVRDQRSVRGRHDGGDEGARPAAREGQRERRRVRARPSDRRVGRPHPRHADRRAARARSQARRGEPVHRRRRGDRDGHRADLT